MFNEDRSSITLRYGIIKGFVSIFMHVVADKRFLRKDRKIAQIGIFGFMAVVTFLGFFYFGENWMKTIMICLSGVSLLLCALFVVIYIKKKDSYLFADDHIVDVTITKDGINAVVNGEERSIKLDGTVNFTIFEDFYIFKDGYGGFFIPFSELDPNEKTTLDLWFATGAVYEQGKLKGKKRVPKLKY